MDGFLLLKPGRSGTEVRAHIYLTPIIVRYHAEGFIHFFSFNSHKNPIIACYG